MANKHKTPEVYIENVSELPPSVTQVTTAVPAFIGYTQKTELNGNSLKNQPTCIHSLTEYECVFGDREEVFEIKVGANSAVSLINYPKETKDFFKMYYSMRMYFANGGSPCYIISIGKDDTSSIELDHFIEGLAQVALEDEPTLLVFPDAEILERDDFYSLYQEALAQCNELKNRFLICDVYNGDKDFSESSTEDVINGEEDGFRNLIGANYLGYAAAYYPHLETIQKFGYDESKIKIENGSSVDVFLRDNNKSEEHSIYHSDNESYTKIKKILDNLPVVLPPSSSIAGVYARVDASRGVWKTPANISLNCVRKLTVKIDNTTQECLNVNTEGKSINALRKFTGKGNLVWGARTLDGNNNEWRYINVRRFFIMVEESTKKACERFVFEPNDANTWVRIRAMIENFLMHQWRAGALAGAKPEHAFYVRVGLGQSMTTQDILDGKMIIEIGMAVIRPAEFTVLNFS